MKLKLLFLFLILCGPVFAQVGITEKLGSAIPPDLEFNDEEGKPVLLGSYFDGKTPVILNLVYFGCPNLCTMVLNGLTSSLKETPWSLGKKFRVVTVSINANEGPGLARLKKKSYLENYGRTGAESGWAFLTGKAENIQKLADAIGFGFRYDEGTKQFLHGAGLFVLTPQGVVSRVLYGTDYKPRDLKLALLNATEGKNGNLIDKLLMFCYHFDADSKKYELF